MVMGAPIKYEPEFCEQVIKHGKQGKSLTQIASALGVSRQSIYNWMDEYPNFFDAINLARTHAQAKWEDMGFEATFGTVPNFSASAFIFQMKNRFPDSYRERVESVNFSADYDEDDEEIMQRAVERKRAGSSDDDKR